MTRKVRFSIAQFRGRNVRGNDFDGRAFESLPRCGEIPGVPRVSIGNGAVDHGLGFLIAAALEVPHIGNRSLHSGAGCVFVESRPCRGGITIGEEDFIESSTLIGSAGTPAS